MVSKLVGSSWRWNAMENQKSMKKLNLLTKFAVATAVGALMVLQAQATTSYQWAFTFSEGGLVGNGTLLTSGNSGTVSVTGGTLDVTASPVGGYTGVYSLVNPGGSGTVLGGINYNNVLNNLTGANSYIQTGAGGGPYLNQFNFGSSGGLAFGQVGGNRIDIFSTTVVPGLGFALGNGYPSHLDDNPGVGRFTLTAVPEVSTFAIATVGMLGLVFIGRNVMKRRLA